MRLQDPGRRVERALLIDADDTLWENNIFYLRCQSGFQDLMATHGHSREAAAAMLDLVEHETIPVMGYGPDGYVAALGVACERLLNSADGAAAPDEAIARARALGSIVLDMPLITLPGVEATLEALQPSSELILVTKGDETVQRSKLERSGLAPCFDAVYVVAEKDAAVYRGIAAERGLRPGHTWMVGNSPRSDINPAIAAGLGAILVPHNHTWTAEVQEIVRPDLVVTLQRFADLLPFFGIEPAFDR